MEKARRIWQPQDKEHERLNTMVVRVLNVLLVNVESQWVTRSSSFGAEGSHEFIS